MNSLTFAQTHDSIGKYQADIASSKWAEMVLRLERSFCPQHCGPQVEEARCSENSNNIIFH